MNTDTRFFYQALRNWQERNQTFKTWDRLNQSQRSEIMSNAADLKNHGHEMSPEGLRNREACEAILLRRSS
jgi:response regulator of citrate/malate metabolism